MGRGVEQTRLPRRHTNSEQVYEKMFNLPATREVQVRTTMRYHLTPVRLAIINKTSDTSVGEVVEKREPSFTAVENVHWHSHYGKLS